MSASSRSSALAIKVLSTGMPWMPRAFWMSILNSKAWSFVAVASRSCNFSVIVMFFCIFSSLMSASATTELSAPKLRATAIAPCSLIMDSSSRAFAAATPRSCSAIASSSFASRSLSTSFRKRLSFSCVFLSSLNFFSASSISLSFRSFASAAFASSAAFSLAASFSFSSAISLSFASISARFACVGTLVMLSSLSSALSLISEPFLESFLPLLSSSPSADCPAPLEPKLRNLRPTLSVIILAFTASRTCLRPRPPPALMTSFQSSGSSFRALL
mmetsp:Transcript_18496/g.39792  ORF Transcript_18496/g.39792 Transcript_18496/m.39792 type:complete len:274 (-) Transcript_18496:1458-2279(-)